MELKCDSCKKRPRKKRAVHEGIEGEKYYLCRICDEEINRTGIMALCRDCVLPMRLVVYDQYGCEDVWCCDNCEKK